MFSAEVLLAIFGPQSEFYQKRMAPSHNSSFLSFAKQNPRLINTWKQALDPWLSSDSMTEEIFTLYVYLYHIIAACLCSALDSYNVHHHLQEEHKLTLHDYLPLITTTHFGWPLDKEILTEFYEQLLKGSLNQDRSSPEVCDCFQSLHQALFSIANRQAMGEFYTPPLLARKITTEVYQSGQNFLDPTCGSGIFLIEAMRVIDNAKTAPPRKKYEAIQRIFGFDINPIAIIAARVNLFINVIRKWDITSGEIRNLGSILEKNIREFSPITIGEPEEFADAFSQGIDAVAGNPPWQVLNRIQNPVYKLHLKSIAKELDLLPPAHQITQLELSAIILYRLKPYLRKGALIGLIVSNAFIMGDNHVKTRQFHEFDEIKFWKFSRDLFRIHNTVLFVKYAPGMLRNMGSLEYLLVPVCIFSPKGSGNQKYQEFNLECVKTENYTPLLVEPVGSSFMVKRLVPCETKKTLIPMGDNPYYGKCFNGATIFPRNLVFVESLSKKELALDKSGNQDLVKVKPYIHEPKLPWNFSPLKMLNFKSESVEIEASFLFKILKSECVLPFYALAIPLAILPITPSNSIKKPNGYEFCDKSNFSAIHYFNQLDMLYRQHIKKSSPLQTLWENLNYQGKLTAIRQRSPFRVVMMGSGTLVKACLIRDPEVIVDYTNFFLSFDIEEEAFYLLGFLNSPELTRSVQIIQAEGAGGKGRHIQKRPFLFSWPKFDTLNSDHQKLVAQAKKMETKAHKFIDRVGISFGSQTTVKKQKTMSLQRALYADLDKEYQELNRIVLSIIHARSLSSK